VFLRQRRPQIHTALVDAATGQPLAWVTAPARTPRPMPRPRVLPLSKNL
jgi:hypothetical protein